MELLILNKKFESIGVVDSFESLIWTERYCSSGDFELYTTASADLMNLIQADYYVWTDSSDTVMIVEGREIETNVDTGNHLKITGRSLESILDRRIVWVQTVLNGNFQNAIKKLLDENIINPTLSERRIENFVFQESDDPEITDLTIDTQTTGDNLYDVIVTLCESKRLGFKITLNEENQFVFSLYKGEDRSYEQDLNPYVVFSPNFENIINSNYIESFTYFKNVALVAADGEGPNRRTTVVGKADASGLDRRELYVDARDIQTGNTAQMTQRGEEDLKEKESVQSFEGQVETTQLYRYKEDFFMGDIVQFENEYGLGARVRVVEFITSENQSGIEMYPTFNVIDKDEEEEE